MLLDAKHSQENKLSRCIQRFTHVDVIRRVGLACAVLTGAASTGTGCAPSESSEPGNGSVSQPAVLAAASLSGTSLIQSSASVVKAPTALLDAVLTARVPEVTRQDCSTFDAYTAALGAYTVDCIGTIGPKAYEIDDKGYMHRRFDKCTVGGDEILKTIDGLLSLQVREHQRPNKQGIRLDPVACMGGRYQAWTKRFQATGISECPVWKKVEVLGEPTEELIKSYTKLLPQLSKEGTRVKEEPPVAKQNFRYKVQFESGKQDSQCQDPASCAAACIGGFPGALVKAGGEEVVLDPDYWLDPSATTTVYRAGGYYHGMSYKGSVPGDIWGHANRAGEACSYFWFDDYLHYPGILFRVAVGGPFPGEMSECIPL